MYLSAVQFLAEDEETRRQLREEAAGVAKPEMSIMDMDKMRPAETMAPAVVTIDGVDYHIMVDVRSGGET